MAPGSRSRRTTAARLAGMTQWVLADFGRHGCRSRLKPRSAAPRNDAPNNLTHVRGLCELRIQLDPMNFAPPTLLARTDEVIE